MTIKYKIRNTNGIEDILNVELKISIPKDLDNRHYQEFLQDVKEQGLDIVEGPDVITPDYKELRQNEYPPIGEQLDQLYWDAINGTTTWRDAIAAVKNKYPKSQLGTTIVAPLPDWVVGLTTS
tara:strand:+ start:1396 stop:1764 length:369 start_codon:yes stop_codon:yes gene_type:complete